MMRWVVLIGAMFIVAGSGCASDAEKALQTAREGNPCLAAEMATGSEAATQKYSEQCFAEKNHKKDIEAKHNEVNKEVEDIREYNRKKREIEANSSSGGEAQEALDEREAHGGE